jgi:hypothetical protein
MDNTQENAFDTRAAPVGHQPGRIDKRPGDSRPYLIDCAPLLHQHELITAVESFDVQGPDASLAATAARSRRGVSVEVTLSGGSVPTSRPSVDYGLRLLLRTTRGVIDAVITVRVHR